MSTPTEKPQPKVSLDRLALSPSRAGDYQQCPLLYRFRSIDKLPEPKTIAQVKGTLVHAVLEELHALPREERIYPAAVKMLKPAWAKMVEKDPDLNELVPEDQLYDFLVDARALVKGYFQMENPQGFDAHEVEEFVEATLPNGVPVRGFIDRVDVAANGQVRVVDYKTGKKPPPRFAAQALFQMKFYALVYWRLYDLIPAQLRLMYLKVADDLVLQPTPAELQYFERDLRELWDSILADIHSGDFQPKTSKLCDWCAFQELCPAFGGTPPEYPGVR
ncbi:RecB family exonuclease [Corynebacterium urealyticum]|uniref:RecB family exonuclease n=1 Tax=Corynebacterium urealyticum TaxID=43771 RepID=UPI0011E66C44|nr:RecB family exonuclease [Corynebacterium urealyticum]TYR16141.1 RecB family exonuclease [Corynebacterium urealyticum]TYT20228.1 RecB family exonuclease [Corynebacterium urealyticum]